MLRISNVKYTGECCECVKNLTLLALLFMTKLDYILGILKMFFTLHFGVEIICI